MFSKWDPCRTCRRTPGLCWRQAPSPTLGAGSARLQWGPGVGSHRVLSQRSGAHYVWPRWPRNGTGRRANCYLLHSRTPRTLPYSLSKDTPFPGLLGAEANHGGGRLGGEADLLFTSHKISFSGGAAKRMYSRMVSMPYCSTTSSGSTPLCLDLLIFSQLTSSFSLVFAWTGSEPGNQKDASVGGDAELVLSQHIQSGNTEGAVQRVHLKNPTNSLSVTCSLPLDIITVV